MSEANSIVNIVLGGVGGQGVLVASDILSNAALKADFDVKKSEVHGMAQRGGSVFSHIRFGPKIYSPLIGKGTADFLLAFEKLEALRYLEYLKPDGILLVNNQQITPLTVYTSKVEYPKDIEAQVRQKGYRYLGVDGIAITEELGNIRLLNVVMLGTLANYLEFSDEIWFESIKERLPEKFHEINLQAFQMGKNAIQPEK